MACFEDSISATGEGGDFCTEIESSIVLDEDLSLAAPGIERILAQAVDEFDDFRSQAPDGMAPDVDSLYQALLLMDEIVGAYGYDLSAVPEDESSGWLIRRSMRPTSTCASTAVSLIALTERP